MSLIVGSAVTGAGGGAYTIDNSLRLRKSASASLSRTPSANGNRQIFTWSGWVKRGQLGTGSTNRTAIFSSGNTAAPQNGIVLKFQDDNLYVLASGLSTIGLITSAVYRDPSSWYHIVMAIDTTQATASNRVKLYVNGSQITAFSTATYPSQNYNVDINNTSNTMYHGLENDGGTLTNYFDGYIAEARFIDGQQLTPSSFGATNASTGVWQPTAYTGTYGTNGFYQKYSSIATTSGSNAGLGQDFSGNGNYFNTSNISVTAGVTYDAMTDSPTPKSSTVGNFCTLNPLDQGGGSSSSGANLQFNSTSSDLFAAMRGTFGVTSGKWYFEATPTTFGVGAPDKIVRIGVSNTFYNIDANGGDVSPSGGSAIWDSRDNGATSYLYLNGVSGNSYAYSFTVNDVVMVAFDADTGKIWFGKNGTWNTGSPSAGTGEAATLTSGYVYTPIADGSNSTVTQFNFGQRPFSYTPPTGFNRFQTYNLPTPTIGASSTTLANKYFDANLWTGNGTSQTISSYAFQPDFAWIKTRSTADNNNLMDAVRGATKRLVSNSTSVESTETQMLTAFTSNGFSLGTDAGVNGSGTTYVGWAWKANGSGSSNTSGSITSTVSANTTSGFSVVTYTGTGANATVGHGLGVAPKMYITKARSTSGYEWMVYHSSLGNTQYIYLSTTGAAGTSSLAWNNTSPTSTVFSLGTGTYGNANGTTYVAYCFAEIAGFSKFGSYAGNSSTDGTFVYTGFRPAYVMIKRSSAAGQWSVRDDMRLGYNPNNYALEANQSTAETSSTAYTCDLLSNGFKLRTADDAVNLSGSTYIYMAFAEFPLNYSLAR